MSYPNPDITSLPSQRSVIRSLPASIKLETIQDELHKQGFAVIQSTLTNTREIYIPPTTAPSTYPKEEHPKKQKKSTCSIQ